MNNTFLLLGSNIEPRFDYLDEAIRRIERKIGKTERMSSIFESEPWGFEANKHFLNCVVQVKTELTARELLKEVLSIEKSMGRTRQSKGYVSRNIDIDILYFNHDVIHCTGLDIPHPRLHERRFTLEPLAEIAGSYMHPVLGKTNAQLLKAVSDHSSVIIYKKEKKDEV